MEYSTSEIVILIDAAYLDKEAGAMADFMSREVVKRELSPADIATFLTAITLDAGITTGKNEIQAIFVYDKSHSELVHWVPNSLTHSLNDMAFRNELGEFSLAAYSNEQELVSTEALYGEIMKLLATSKGTHHLLLVGDVANTYLQQCPSLEKVTDRKVSFFSMNPDDASKTSLQHHQLGFSLLRSLGIKADEL